MNKVKQTVFAAELKKVLPRTHPILEKLDESIVRSTDVKDLVDATDAMIHIMQDWKRGIRDWSEVEDGLDRVRAELAAYKEEA